MTQKIDVYKSVVEMDSKPYVDGAKAGEKAAKDFVKADEQVQTQTTKRKIVDQDPTFAQYEKRLLAFDKLAKARKVYADQEAFVKKAMAAPTPVINEQQASALLDAVASRYEKLGISIRETTAIQKQFMSEFKTVSAGITEWSKPEVDPFMDFVAKRKKAYESLAKAKLDYEEQSRMSASMVSSGTASEKDRAEFLEDLAKRYEKLGFKVREAAKAQGEALAQFKDVSESLTENKRNAVDPFSLELELRRHAYDRLAKAQYDYRRQEEFANYKVSIGESSEKQRTDFLNSIAAHYENLGLKVRGAGTELENSAKRIALNRFQLMSLQYTANDVAASLASGINPFTILMQQGGQLTQAFGGIRGTINTFVQMVGVARLSMIGLGAAFALSIVEAEKQNRFYGEMERRLKGLGEQADLSKEQLKGLVTYADRMPGVSTKEAKTAVSDLVTTAHVSKSMYTDLIALAEKYAVVTGSDLPTAMHTLATGFKNTSGFARELQSNVKGFESFSYAVYAKIKAMEESGRQDEAQRQLLAEMQKTLVDVDSRGVTPLMRATEDLADAWATLKGAVAPTLTMFGEAGTKILTHMANNVTKLTLGLRMLHETFQALARLKMPDYSQTKDETPKKTDAKADKSLPGPGALERQARLAADAERERSREAKALIQSLAQENQTRMKGLALLERQKRETLEQAQAVTAGGEREVAITKAKEEALRIMDEYHLRDEAFRQRELADWQRLAAMKYDNEQREKERLKILEEQKQIATQLSEKLSSGITSAFRDGTTAAQFFKNMMLDMLEEIAKKQFLMPLFSSLLGGGGPASFLTSFFGGGHAQGGTVSPNHYYTVGENGPETFVPSKSGSIIPNQSSGSKTINFNVNVAANSPAAKDRQSAESAGRAMALAARAELQDFLASEKRFGGSLYGVGA